MITTSTWLQREKHNVFFVFFPKNTTTRTVYACLQFIQIHVTKRSLMHRTDLELVRKGNISYDVIPNTHHVGIVYKGTASLLVAVRFALVRSHTLHTTLEPWQRTQHRWPHVLKRWAAVGTFTSAPQQAQLTPTLTTFCTVTTVISLTAAPLAAFASLLTEAPAGAAASANDASGWDGLENCRRGRLSTKWPSPARTCRTLSAMKLRGRSARLPPACNNLTLLRQWVQKTCVLLKLSASKRCSIHCMQYMCPQVNTRRSSLCLLHTSHVNHELMVAYIPLPLCGCATTPSGL